MSKYHVSSKTGQPAICNASIKACPLGEAAHGSTPAEALKNYEKSHLPGELFQRVSKSSVLLRSQRNSFFGYGKSGGNVFAAGYALIHTSTGTVIGDNCYVFDMDGMDEDEQEEFYNEPYEYISNENSMPMKITEASDLTKFKNPVVVSAAGDVIDCNNVYVIDTRNEPVDFDEILSSDRAAKEVAENQGFLLWD